MQERTLRDKSQDNFSLSQKAELYKTQRNSLMEKQRTHSANLTASSVCRPRLGTKTYNLESVSDFSQTKKMHFSQYDQLLDVSKEES